MKQYTINVDGKYFVGETMQPIKGQSIAPSGFFQMVSDNTATAYAYSERVADASKMILYNALGYLQGIYDRTRYLPDVQKPHMISIEEVPNAK